MRVLGSGRGSGRFGALDTSARKLALPIESPPSGLPNETSKASMRSASAPFFRNDVNVGPSTGFSGSKRMIRIAMVQFISVTGSESASRSAHLAKDFAP
jgi:hypothetical protein